MQGARSSCAGQSRLAGVTGPSPAARAQQWRRPCRGTACRAHAAVQSQPELQQLLNWAAGAKIAVDKVAVAQDVATGRPVLVAGKDLAQGEQVLAVPDSAWVTPQAAQQHASIGRLVGGLEPWLQLALLLLAERAAGASAALQPYLATAAAAASAEPGSGGGALDSPLFWGEEELALLQGTQLLESLRGYKQFFREQYDSLRAQLFDPNPAAFPADAFSYERFVWAVAAVRSRLHAPLDADPLALVPLADAIPHKRAGNVAWRAKAAGVFGRGRSLAVEATRAVRKGEALAMDYGPDRPDSALLLDYGVLDAAAAQGGYALTLTLPEGDTYYADKADILERAGLGPAATFAITRGAEPPEEMMAFLRLMQLSGPDCFLLEPIFEAEVWAFMCAPVSQANEAALCGAMVEGAREALAGYATSLEEDLGLLRGEGPGALAPGSRQEAAVQVRLGEKEALDGLMAFFEGRGADLKALEYYQERRLKRLGLMDEDGSTTYDSFFKDGIA